MFEYVFVASPLRPADSKAKVRTWKPVTNTSSGSSQFDLPVGLYHADDAFLTGSRRMVHPYGVCLRTATPETQPDELYYMTRENYQDLKEKERVILEMTLPIEKLFDILTFF